MLRCSNLELKETKALQPGELIRISFGEGTAIALYMEALENGKSVVGMLKAPGFTSAMIWHTPELDTECLSYGVDWVIEEVHGPQTAAGRRTYDSGARLFLQKDGLVMCFHPGQSPDRYHVINFHLADQVGIELSRQAAPISEWRIWESEEHLERGGDPIFEFPNVA